MSKPKVTKELAALAWQRAYAEGDESGVDMSLRVARQVALLLVGNMEGYELISCAALDKLRSMSITNTKAQGPVTTGLPDGWGSWAKGDTVRYIGSGEHGEMCHERMTVGSDYLIHEHPDSEQSMSVLDDDGDEISVLVGEFELIRRAVAKQVVMPERDLIASLVREIERNTCTHEETHRGGVIWEICDSCGAQWSDDRNPKPEFQWPDCVEAARTLLAHLNAAPEQS
jgi:hypothetical protein